MPRSVVLGSILLVGCAVAILIARVGESGRGAGRSTGRESVDEARAAAAVELEAPALPVEVEMDADGAEEAGGARRATARDEGRTIAGRVVGASPLPAGEEVNVVAEVFVGPVNRRGNSRKLATPVAADGSFALAVPSSARYALLDVEARYLFLPEVVRALPGATDVVLNPEVSAVIAGRVLPPLGVALRAEEEAWDGVSVSLTTVAPVDGTGPYYVPGSSFGRRGVAHLLAGGETALGRIYMPMPAASDQEVVPRGDGSFVFSLVPTGVELELRVTGPHPDCVQRIAPLAPREKREVVLAVDGGITVAGRVVDEHGQPVEGARVATRDELRLGELTFGGPTDREVETDAAGGFALEGLPAGRLKITAQLSGSARDAEAFLDGSDGDVRDVVLVIERGSCIEGTVEWPDGRPVERFSVASIDPGDPKRASGAAGRFRLCLRGHGPHALEVSATGDDVEGSARVSEVRPGDTDLRIVLETSPLFTVRGTVVDQDGDPVSSFRVRARSGESLASRPYSYPPVEGRGGSFAVSGLRPGEWKLRVEGMGLLSAEQTVRVGPETARLRFVLRPGCRVSGQVLDARGTPVEGAHVGEPGVLPVYSLLRERNSTDEEGRFSITATTSPSRLQASCTGHAPSAVVEVAVDGGTPVEDVVLHLRTPCRLEGRVLDADGRPVAGARVGARAADAYGQAESDVRGEFTIENLPPGTVAVSAHLQSGERAEGEVELAAGRTSTLELRFDAPRPAGAEGGD